MGLLCSLFTSLSLYPFHLSIPLYPSLSLSVPLSPSLSLSLSLSLSPSLPASLSLSLLSLSPSLYHSFYLSFTLFPSLSLLFIILFGVSNGRFRPCFMMCALHQNTHFFPHLCGSYSVLWKFLWFFLDWSLIYFPLKYVKTTIYCKTINKTFGM